MSLALFIEKNVDRLVGEWEAHARGCEPLTTTCDAGERGTEARALLLAIAAELAASHDVERRQTGDAALTPDLTHCSQAYAAERLGRGSSLEQLIAEHRALRASVIRHWRASGAELGESDCDDLVRFVEAIDGSLEESVKGFAASLEQAHDSFIEALDHDMRTPLAALGFSVDFLLFRKSLGSEETRAAVRIGNAVGQLQRMIGDLLDFRRARLGGHLALDLDTVDMTAVCRRAIDRLTPFAGTRPLTLETRGDTRGTWDHGRLERVLMTLIASAIDCSEERGAVTITIDGSADEVQAIVHSNGMFPEQARRVVLDPTLRGREDEAYAGLALQVTKHIVDAHGGALEIASSFAGGTTFRACFPRRPPLGA